MGHEESKSVTVDRRGMEQAIWSVARVLLAFNLVAVVVVSGAVLMTRARLVELFRKFAVELAGPARWVLELPSLWLVAATFATASLLVVAHLRGRRADRVVRFHVAVALVVVTAWSAYVGIMFMSLIKLIELLSRQ